MKCQIPQISWHERTPVLSVDFQIIDKELRRLATGGTDSHVVIWHVDLCSKGTVTVECACELSRHNKSVNVVRFSPNGEYLASGDDEGAIFIWKLREKNMPDLDDDEKNNKENWHPLKLLRGHLDDISDLNWSPDSDFLLSGSIDNSAIIWDIQKGQSFRVLKDAKSFVQGVAWDPLNQYQATISSDRFVRIYNATNGKVLHRIHKLPSTEITDKTPGKGKLFHDDTLQSFCRRLTFSPDGELLFVPSGIREKEDSLIHTTYVFSRYNLTAPAFHLPSGQKYAVAVRCCPVYFKLKETSDVTQRKFIDLPYRILIAVATQDAVLLYDTQQLTIFGCVSNIHYTHLSDISWSSDGRMLIVSSTDGYCSFIIFNKGELGEVYIPEVKPVISCPPTEISIIESETKKPKTPQIEKILTDNRNIAKDSPVINIDSESPNANKTAPISNKKIYTIKNFFTPPGKKTKKDDDDLDDCIIVHETNFSKETKHTESDMIVTDVDMTDVSTAELSQEKENLNNEDACSEAPINGVNASEEIQIDKPEINNMKITDMFKPKREVKDSNSETSNQNEKSIENMDVKSDLSEKTDIEMVDVEKQEANPAQLQVISPKSVLCDSTILSVASTSKHEVREIKATDEAIKPKKRIAFTTLSTKVSFK